MSGKRGKPRLMSNRTWARLSQSPGTDLMLQPPSLQSQDNPSSSSGAGEMRPPGLSQPRQASFVGLFTQASQQASFTGLSSRPRLMSGRTYRRRLRITNQASFSSSGSGPSGGEGEGTVAAAAARLDRLLSTSRSGLSSLSSSLSGEGEPREVAENGDQLLARLLEAGEGGEEDLAGPVGEEEEAEGREAREAAGEGELAEGRRREGDGGNGGRKEGGRGVDREG